MLDRQRIWTFFHHPHRYVGFQIWWAPKYQIRVLVPIGNVLAPIDFFNKIGIFKQLKSNTDPSITNPTTIRVLSTAVESRGLGFRVSG